MSLESLKEQFQNKEDSVRFPIVS